MRLHPTFFDTILPFEQGFCISSIDFFMIMIISPTLLDGSGGTSKFTTLLLGKLEFYVKYAYKFLMICINWSIFYTSCFENIDTLNFPGQTGLEYSCVFIIYFVPKTPKSLCKCEWWSRKRE